MTRRQHIIAAIALALFTSAAFFLFRRIKPSPGYFTDEILACVSASTTEERLEVITSESSSTLLGPAGLPCGMPNAGLWTIEVPWAKNQDDTDRVLNALSSHPEILWAELNGTQFVRTISIN